MSKILTLIGVKLAKKNRKFLFTGPTKECENCDPSLKSVCIENLEKGCVYEILKIRNITHPCNIYQNGVIVIEVQRSPIKIAIEAKFAYESAIIPIQLPDCDDTTCKNYQYCKPLGISVDDKYKIIKVFGNLPEICKNGKKLKLVEIYPM